MNEQAEQTGPTDQSDLTGLVLAGGRLPPHWLARRVIDGADLVVAADGGLAHAPVLGIVPDLLVGDLDSVSPALLADFPGLATEAHPVDKDELDLELAIDALLRRGVREVRVLGAFGGRLDQSLASLLIGARYASSGVRVGLHGDLHEAYVLAAAPGAGRFDAVVADGTTVSLLALEAGTVVSTTGLAYELTEEELPYGVGLGLSNRAGTTKPGAPERGAARPDRIVPEPAAVTTDPGARGRASPASVAVAVEVHAGTVAVIIEHAHAAVAATTALWGTQEERVRSAVLAADPDLANLIEEFAYERVFERPGLDHRTRELIAVALLASMGATDELPTHLRAALQVGATERELREAIIHTGAYAGLPRALAAMRGLAGLLERRRGQRGSTVRDGFGGGPEGNLDGEATT